MKKVILAAGVLVAALAALRRLGPRLGERAMKKCEEMFDRMPEDFPPKQMMRGIEQFRQQNVEILRQMGKRSADARNWPGSSDGPSARTAGQPEARASGGELELNRSRRSASAIH